MAEAEAVAVEGETVPPVTESKESTVGDTTISTLGDTTESTLEEGTENTESNAEQAVGADHSEARADDKASKEDGKAAEDKELTEADKKEEVNVEEPIESNQTDEKQEEGVEEGYVKEDDGVKISGGDEQGGEKGGVSAGEPEGESIASAGKDEAGVGEEKDDKGESGEEKDEGGEDHDEGRTSGEGDKIGTSETEAVEDTDGPTEAAAQGEASEGAQQKETTEQTTMEQKAEEQAKEADEQAQTVPLSGKPATDSVAVLTAIAEEEEEDDKEELRQELIEQMLSALEEKKELESQRDTLEYAIAEHLARKKAEKEQLELPRPAPDIRKYSIILNKITELRNSMEKAQERQTRKEEKLVVKMNNDLEQARRAREYLIECRKDRFVGLLNSRTGKRITVADLDHYHALEDEKEEEIKKIRLNNIKLMAKMSKLSESLRQKEQLAQGLHMIDFEQLKINNIDLNEKIEERNDDILKLRKKVTSTVQVLTHVKEKLQFLQQEKAERKAVLGEIEVQLAMKRDELTHLKQARDALRADNQRLKQKGGLVGHKTLLRDFEERLDESEEMRQRLEQLQKRHSELSVMCDGIKKKIETAKMLESEAMANR